MDFLYKLSCSIFHPLRLHLSRWHPSREESFRVLGLIRELDIDTVIDVGANTGQFAHSMLSQGFTGRIHSFEPQAVAHRQLQDHAQGHPSWTVAERCALGESPGELDLHLSQNSYSSSFLPVNPVNLQAAPRTAYVGQERVRVLRLDDWAQRIGICGRLLLKIDTQGFELKVLRGAQGLMPLIHGILVECSLVPLYDGQPLLQEIMDFLRDAHFQVIDILPGLRDPRSGRILGLDLLARRQAPDPGQGRGQPGPPSSTSAAPPCP